jgi:hypothetical protein
MNFFVRKRVGKEQHEKPSRGWEDGSESDIKQL